MSKRIESTNRTGGSTQTVRTPISGETPLVREVDRMVRKGVLYRRLPDQRVRCYACGHRCRINAGGRGICQVRYNRDGELYVPWGYVAALQRDPTEKKPFFHVYPGSDTLTFGMLGCDLHCPYCQNWDISQALRDSNAGRLPMRIQPGELIELAMRSGARCVASSYNEPLITAEWATAIFRAAQATGLATLFISNGNATREVLQFIRPVTAGYKIDLKSMRDRSYRQLGAVLDHILEGIQQVHQLGFWLEIVTLVIPGFNDSDAELQDAAQFIHSISPDIPWHVTGFHKDYKMREPEDTSARTLRRAAEIGYRTGLHYVYAGNRPGQVGPFENTRCPTCQTTLIERLGYVVLSYRLTEDGHCPDCHTPIPGLWPADPAEVRLGRPGDLFLRRPRRV